MQILQLTYRFLTSISSSRSKSKISFCPAQFKNLDSIAPERIAVAIRTTNAHTFFTLYHPRMQLIQPVLVQI